MSQTLIITCDRCGCKVGSAHRTRVRWGKQPFPREPFDLCAACAEALADFLKRGRPTVTPVAEAPGPARRVPVPRTESHAGVVITRAD